MELKTQNLEFGEKDHEQSESQSVIENEKKKKNRERTMENEFWERKWKWENLDFLIENAAENIIQGGYQVSSDTMLGNMASMEEMREN